MPVFLKRAKIRACDMGSMRNRLDVTAKSSCHPVRRLAPDWEIVASSKAGKISEEVYQERYFRALDAIEPEYFHDLARRCDLGTITFVCYCKLANWCHTDILINYLVARFPDLFADGRPKPKESESGMHLLGIDLETTGLNPRYHEITQIGAILMDSKLSEIGKMETFVAIDHPERGLERGFNVFEYTGIDPQRDLKGAPKLREALRSLETFVRSHVGFGMSKVVVFGQNPRFDVGFLETGYEKLGWKYPFDFHVLGLESMYVYHHVKKTGKLPDNITLKGICKSAGVKNAKAHNALADIKAAVSVMKKLLKD